MDREKVIKGLHQHCECSLFDRCGECPYYAVSDEQFSCRDRLLEDVLFLLKEQEAVTPYIDIDEARCPICKVKLTRQELLGDDVLFEDFFDYCPRCGRKVKWE